MDADRFDSLTRILRAGSRRQLLRTLSGVVLGAGLAGLGADEANEVAARRRRRGPCPSGRVRRRGRCRACRNDGECGRQYDLIFGICVNGRCKECETDDWCDFIWEGEFPYCIANVCKECRTTANCSGGQSCTTNGTCVDACRNGARDGDETDVDCGGAACPTCGAGKECQANSDCQSGSCDGCGDCGDGRLLCEEAGQCTSNADCPSGVACVGGACTGTCLPPGAPCDGSDCTECCFDDCSTGDGFVCSGFDGSCG